jgi:hypothetical protein
MRGVEVLGREHAAPLDVTIAVEEVLDPIGELARGRPPRRVGRERGDARGVELGWDVGVGAVCGGAIRRKLRCVERRGERARAAWMQRLAGEDLEQDGAERVDVGGGADGVAARLLGGHVAGCAE